MNQHSELAAIEFAINPEPRCPCVLLLDTSGSMQGAKIDGLNQGLSTLRDALLKDSVASRRVELAVIAFNSDITVLQDFGTPDQFHAPTLAADGLTHMGGAIHAALDLIGERKSEYRANGISYYRPWVFMITDGEPQGEPDSVVQQAAQRIRDEEQSKRIAFFAVGVEGANLSKLSQLSVRPPVKLQGLEFSKMFLWLSNSMGAVSRSQTSDDQVPLPAPSGWASV